MTSGKSSLFGGDETFQDPLAPKNANSEDTAEEAGRLAEDLLPKAKSLLKAAGDADTLQFLSERIGLDSPRESARLLSGIYERHLALFESATLPAICLKILFTLDRFQREQNEEKESAVDMAGEVAPVTACFVDTGQAGCSWRVFLKELEEYGICNEILDRVKKVRERLVFPNDLAFNPKEVPETAELRDAYQNLSLGIGIDLYRYEPWRKSAGRLVEEFQERIRLAGRFGQASGRSSNATGRTFFQREVDGIPDRAFIRLCARFAEIVGSAADSSGFSEMDPVEYVRPVVSWLTERLPTEGSFRPIGREDFVDFEGAMRALILAAREEPELMAPLVETFAQFDAPDPAARRAKKGGGSDENDPMGERIGFASCSSGPPRKILDEVSARLGRDRQWRSQLLEFLGKTDREVPRTRAIEDILLFRMPIAQDMEKCLVDALEKEGPPAHAAIRILGELGGVWGAKVLRIVLHDALKGYPNTLPRCRRVAFSLGRIYRQVEDSSLRDSLDKDIKGLPQPIAGAFGEGSGGSYVVLTQSQGGPVVPENVLPEPIVPERKLADILADARRGPIQKRVKAIGELARHPVVDSIELLIEILEENDLILRENASHSLRTLGPRAVPYLESAIETACSGWMKTRKAEKAAPMITTLFAMGHDEGMPEARAALDRLVSKNKGVATLYENLEKKAAEEKEHERRRAMLNLTPREVAAMHRAEKGEENGSPASRAGTELQKKIAAYRARKQGGTGLSPDIGEEEAELERRRIEKARKKALGGDADKIGK